MPDVASVPPYRAHLRCFRGCPGQFSVYEVIYSCPACGGLLEVQHDVDALRARSAAEWRQLLERRAGTSSFPYGSGVWGMREWVMPDLQDEHVVSMYEGNTNLFWAERLGQTIGVPDLWVKLCGNSHCFRTEAGAHGRATRGLYRVHQFTKVEMFAFTLPDQSEAMHQLLLDLECRLFDGLGIPYRVIDTASGDLGGPAYRKFDLEAWMPGRGEAGEWGEVTSTSNCTDYQARRLGIRFKTPGEKGTTFAHTLNGTAVAISRAIIAILENHQQADGSVTIPAPLVPWMGKDRITPA